MQLSFQHVSLRALGTDLPTEAISSDEIETRLAPTYERLGLVPGRLELMTGIRSRRHYPAGTRPSDIATRAAEDLFRRVPKEREKVDCLIHASVCRNFLEPATATVVHERLGLSPSCLLFDLSNACLSWVNALAMAAGLIECGQVRSALIVCGEDARAIVDHTVDSLNADLALTRQTLKPSFASLTLGSGGAAALLTREPGGARLLGGAFLAQSTWREARTALNWGPEKPDAYFTHQVGDKHRSLMVKGLELDPKKDFSTFERLGNMGAASIGVTLAEGARAQRLREGDSLALLGIGSGLVCGMLGLQWSREVAV